MSAVGCQRWREAAALFALGVALLSACDPSPAPPRPQDYPTTGPAVGPCRDFSSNAANRMEVLCPWPEQTLHFEKDADNDAYFVCRCPRDGGGP